MARPVPTADVLKCKKCPHCLNKPSITQDPGSFYVFVSCEGDCVSKVDGKPMQVFAFEKDAGQEWNALVDAQTYLHSSL